MTLISHDHGPRPASTVAWFKRSKAEIQGSSLSFQCFLACSCQTWYAAQHVNFRLVYLSMTLFHTYINLDQDRARTLSDCIGFAAHVFEWNICMCSNHLHCLLWDANITVWDMIIFMLKIDLGCENPRDNLKSYLEMALAGEGWHTGPVMVLSQVSNLLRLALLCFYILGTEIFELKCLCRPGNSILSYALFVTKWIVRRLATTTVSPYYIWIDLPPTVPKELPKLMCKVVRIWFECSGANFSCGIQFSNVVARDGKLYVEGLLWIEDDRMGEVFLLFLAIKGGVNLRNGRNRLECCSNDGSVVRIVSDVITFKTCIAVVRNSIWIDTEFREGEVSLMSRAIMLCHGVPTGEGGCEGGVQKAAFFFSGSKQIADTNENHNDLWK